MGTRRRFSCGARAGYSKLFAPYSSLFPFLRMYSIC
jgi:hypothetical protein